MKLVLEVLIIVRSLPSCTEDDDCAADRWCNDGSCVPQLGNGVACDRDRACVNLCCTDTCQSCCDNDDCLGTAASCGCVNDVCTVCVDPTPVCLNNTCTTQQVPGCTQDSDCDTGEYCCNQQCTVGVRPILTFSFTTDPHIHVVCSHVHTCVGDECEEIEGITNTNCSIGYSSEEDQHNHTVQGGSAEAESSVNHFHQLTYTSHLHGSNDPGTGCLPDDSCGGTPDVEHSHGVTCSDNVGGGACLAWNADTENSFTESYNSGDHTHTDASNSVHNHTNIACNEPNTCFTAESDGNSHTHEDLVITCNPDGEGFILEDDLPPDPGVVACTVNFLPLGLSTHSHNMNHVHTEDGSCSGGTSDATPDYSSAPALPDGHTHTLTGGNISSLGTSHIHENAYSEHLHNCDTGSCVVSGNDTNVFSHSHNVEYIGDCDVIIGEVVVSNVSTYSHVHTLSGVTTHDHNDACSDFSSPFGSTSLSNYQHTHNLCFNELGVVLPCPE